MRNQFEVELQRFQDGKIRVVTVPEGELDAATSTEQKLDLIFKYGQNDFQPLPRCCSVSVGDVIRLGGERWGVAGIGFTKLAQEVA